MSYDRRLSQSITGSWNEISPLNFISGSDDDAEEWMDSWRTIYARDLIDSRIVAVDAETSVEDACEKLLSEDIPCLVIKAATDPVEPGLYHGLFDFSDVNAFLTLAATRHTFSLDDTRVDTRRDRIVAAAKAGRVSVHFVSNLSDKNPFKIIPYDANIISLLEVFSGGTHRVLIQSPNESGEAVGIVSDRRLLGWFASFAQGNSSFSRYLANPIQALTFPSMNIFTSVVAATSSDSILDAMKLMSEEGVSSIAVLDDESRTLLSAVSVTDIGKVVVPSQSNQILNTPLHQFISFIKDKDGSTDGADRYPVYSVLPSNPLLYTMEKLLVTNAHRVFVTKESTLASPVLSPTFHGNLCGIVSIVDILSLFARLAKIPNVDPTQMQRHRRASSASPHSSKSGDVFNLSRSSSRSSIRRSPSVVASNPPPVPVTDNTRNSISGLDAISITAERRKSLRATKH